MFQIAQVLTPSLKGTEIIWSRGKKLLSYSAARQEDSENVTGYIHPNALSTAPGRAANRSWGALFSETLVECNSSTHTWKWCASLQQSWLPSSLTAASVTLKIKHRSSWSDTTVPAVYLVIMTVLPLLHVFSKKGREKHENLYTFVSLL